MRPVVSVRVALKLVVPLTAAPRLQFWLVVRASAMLLATREPPPRWMFGNVATNSLSNRTSSVSVGTTSGAQFPLTAQDPLVPSNCLMTVRALCSGALKIRAEGKKTVSWKTRRSKVSRIGSADGPADSTGSPALSKTEIAVRARDGAEEEPGRILRSHRGPAGISKTCQ